MRRVLGWTALAVVTVLIAVLGYLVLVALGR